VAYIVKHNKTPAGCYSIKQKSFDEMKAGGYLNCKLFCLKMNEMMGIDFDEYLWTEYKQVLKKLLEFLLSKSYSGSLEEARVKELLANLDKKSKVELYQDTEMVRYNIISRDLERILYVFDDWLKDLKKLVPLDLLRSILKDPYLLDFFSRYYNSHRWDGSEVSVLRLHKFVHRILERCQNFEQNFLHKTESLFAYINMYLASLQSPDASESTDNSGTEKYC